MQESVSVWISFAADIKGSWLSEALSPRMPMTFMQLAFL
jgi:hypothetical protein